MELGGRWQRDTGFREGKRPTIIGTEQLNDTFWEQQIFMQFQEEARFPPREWPSDWENVD